MHRPGGGWFTYFRSEHRGAVVLFSIAFLLVVVPRALNYYKGPKKIQWLYDTTMASRLLQQHQQRQDSAYGKYANTGKHFYYGSKKQLISMGFSEEAAERIENARKQGRVFQSYADLTAETGLDSADLVRIVSPKKFRIATNTYDENHLLNLNDADTNAFIKLPGIGGKTANRIVKYREKLGGFVSAEQLMEIWYVDTVTIRKLFKCFTLENSEIRKIKINEMPETQMAMHPYLTKNQARIIAAYTRQNGNITEMKFMVLAGFSAKERLKLLPYLSFH